MPAVGDLGIVEIGRNPRLEHIDKASFGSLVEAKRRELKKDLWVFLASRGEHGNQGSRGS